LIDLEPFGKQQSRQEFGSESIREPENTCDKLNHKLLLVSNLDKVKIKKDKKLKKTTKKPQIESIHGRI
jgi:hypothetical protein